MSGYVVRCQCGQPERQRQRTLTAPDPSHPPVVAHTTSCPVTILQAWEAANVEVERLTAQPTMFDEAAHAKSLDDLTKHRDRLAKRLDEHCTLSEEPNTLPEGALWFEYPSKINPGSSPARVTLRKDQR